MKLYIANKMCSAELVTIISYPTRASGITVLLETQPTYWKLEYSLTKPPSPSTINHAYAYFI